MAEILDIIDPDGDVKDALKGIRDNFLTQNKQSLRAGAHMLADIVVGTAQTVTSTSYIALTGLSGSFNSSGGLVLVDASIPAFPANRLVNVTLFIDDEEKAWGVCYDVGGQVGANIMISRWIQLNSGNHKWQLKAKVDAGSVSVVAGTDTKTTLSIIEFLRG